MTLYLLGCLVMLLGGWLALIIPNRKIGSNLAVGSVWLGSGMAAVPVIQGFLGAFPVRTALSNLLTGGVLSLGLDPLSSFFCLPVLLIAPLAALYGTSYLSHSTKHTGSHWFFYNLLVISMLLLIAARNGMMFLIVWEMMALSSFFLVMFDDEKKTVQEAGWTYLIATHIGTAALLIFFAWMGDASGSLQFDQMARHHPMGSSAGILFFLALIGFGVKAGFVPLHIWLPEAHPAAPSHVSALMSGVMIKTGIYGVLRTLSLLGNPPEYWGWILIAIGVTSGIAGVVMALAQYDLKRFLAYSSVENIGIITIGAGTGVLGMTWHMPALMILGFGGGLLHVLNHAIFKSLLFLGAGAVFHQTGTLNIEHLGGLLKKMRWTGITFLIGAASISGLPPFNGFISEFYTYFAGISGIMTTFPAPVILAAVILVSLALIGGLAVASFSKAYGIVFLGEPRKGLSSTPTEAGFPMLFPMILLACLCLLIGLGAPFTMYLILPAARFLSGVQEALLPPLEFLISQTLLKVALLFGVVYLLGLLVLFLKHILPRGKQISQTGTWDCGYARPTARMQYTASSYAQPLTKLFEPVIAPHKQITPVAGLFPDQASFQTETPDPVKESIFGPLFRMIARWVQPFRQLHHGNLSGYLLYLAITLIALLIWKAVIR